MSQDDALTSQAQPAIDGPRDLYLSRQDIDRLTAFKWRYSLESRGFTAEQAGRLLFMKWLYRQRAMRG